MHPTHLTQLSTDHRNSLRAEATTSRLLARAERHPRPPSPRYQWTLRSPVVRRPAPISTAVCP
ncbi:MAG: hypothetical protein QOF20_856 [Acidimicrobiaceae bacterium]|jgi:hypothetical protein|nr:hypothetical protein [Acidimicrobiaceae bacterium]MDQ1364033.1 hypothetical protein [Acidimicrobiaceae bacterium]MDQ1368503.1 hypothetical protein [Acidimicrobiaceae bacterium]MDQ1377062.1 hypothetical protein [Acidimicrobiaceae bacterium]MDQ1399383.1 hypothetical protein [Acidimicrobiaceae bacterium]